MFEFAPALRGAAFEALTDSVHVIGAVELGSAWMLAWLAAAAIPLALHLLHRRRQQEMPWAAMELLLQAIRQNSRTVRIEQWLLLLLRTAALILFAIALARPLLRGAASGDTLVSTPPKLWVIVLDASYSMTYTPQRQTLWALAQQRASDLITQTQPGDAFVLIEMAEPSRTVIAQPTFEAAKVAEELARMQCGEGGGDLPSCLELIGQAIEDAKQLAPQQQDVHIVFYTDLGRDSWQSAANGVERRRLQELAKEHTLRIESLAPEAPANFAITAFSTETPLVLRGRSLRVSATVQNFSTVDMQRLPVQFQSEGKTLQTEFVDCPAGATRTVATELQPPSVRYWRVGVAIPADRLSIDNRRDLIVSVRPQVRVVTIEATSGSARYINLSLVPQATLSGLNAPISAAPLTVESWNASELSSRSLADIDAVILVDHTELSKDTISLLRGFVETGGGLLALPGPQAQASLWNRSNQSLGELVGFDLREPTARGDWRVDPRNYASPIAKPFANFQDAGLLSTPIFRYWQIDPRAQAELEIDLAFTNGDPWLLRRRIGSGWAAALVSVPQSGAQIDATADEAWNAMATWPSFVPIMQKIIETIIGGSEQALNLDIGEPLRGLIARQTRALELSVRRPDNSVSRFTVQSDSDDSRQSWTYPSTDRAGVYLVTTGSTPQDDTSSSVALPYAVNIVATQSDLQSLPTASLPSSAQASPTEPRRTVISTDGHSGSSEWISKWCLIGLLAVLGCESVLAWNLGRRLI